MSIRNIAILCMIVAGILAIFSGRYFSRLRKSLPDETFLEVRRANSVRTTTPTKVVATEQYHIPDGPPRTLAAEANGATVRLRFSEWFNQVKMDRSKREKVAAILEK